MRPLSHLLLALVTGEPITRAEGYAIARLILQLLRQTQHAPPSEDDGA